MWNEILEINKDASIEEIKRAYRALAKQYHPDLFNGKSRAEKEWAEDMMKKINDAYCEALKYNNFDILENDEIIKILEEERIKRVNEINNQYKNDEKTRYAKLKELNEFFNRLKEEHIENIKMEKRFCKKLNDMLDEMENSRKKWDSRYAEYEQSTNNLRKKAEEEKHKLEEWRVNYNEKSQKKKEKFKKRRKVALYRTLLLFLISTAFIEYSIWGKPLPSEKEIQTMPLENKTKFEKVIITKNGRISMNIILMASDVLICNLLLIIQIANIGNKNMDEICEDFLIDIKNTESVKRYVK